MDQRLVAYLAGLGFSPEALDGWTVHTAQHAGKDCGFVLEKGCELHFLAFDGKRALSRKNLLKYIAPILARYGYLTTRSSVGAPDDAMRRRLGFELTWTCNGFNFWAMTSIPYERHT